MVSYFCGACGTLTLGNTSRNEKGEHHLSCGCCGFAMNFTIVKLRTRKPADVEEIFQQTALTDNQKGTKKKRGK